LTGQFEDGLTVFRDHLPPGKAAEHGEVDSAETQRRRRPLWPFLLPMATGGSNRRGLQALEDYCLFVCRLRPGRFEIRVIARRSSYIGLIADALGDGDGAVGERVAEFAEGMVMPW
jgi:hypothetical protein